MIIPFIEGDGTGPDIWRASQLVFDAAVQKVHQLNVDTSGIFYPELNLFISRDYRFLTWRGKKLQDIFHKMRIAQIRVNSHPTPNYLFIPVSSLRADPYAALAKLRAQHGVRAFLVMVHGFANVVHQGGRFGNFNISAHFAS